jgi:hypothetical protein
MDVIEKKKSCEFKKTIVFKDFEVQNGVLELEPMRYLFEYLLNSRFTNNKKSRSKYF